MATEGEKNNLYSTDSHVGLMAHSTVKAELILPAPTHPCLQPPLLAETGAEQRSWIRPSEMVPRFHQKPVLSTVLKERDLGSNNIWFLSLHSFLVSCTS